MYNGGTPMNIISYKDNGFTADTLQDMIKVFNKAVQKLFSYDDIVIEHFYYGNSLDMVDVYLSNKHYCCFNLTANRVSMTGCTYSNEEGILFEQLTYNDELYNGRLLEI